MKVCCVCGKELPNRYAVAGKCEEQFCENTFCQLHWHRGNHRCPEHGYEEIEKPDQGVIMNDDSNNRETSVKSKKMSKKVMKGVLLSVKKLGKGASDLYHKLKKDNSPQAMLETLQSQTQANQARRVEVSGKIKGLYKQVVEKKKEYQAASKVRKRILETEVRNALSAYKAAESQLNILLRNEEVLNKIIGKLYEIEAHDLAGISEEFIDDVIDELDDRVAAAEGKFDAARDLDKAGRLKERATDREELLDELAGFEEGEFDDVDEEPLSASDIPLPDVDEEQQKTDRPKKEEEI